MTDERLQALELKLAFLERANQELSDVVYGQQQDLTKLKAQLIALAEQFDVLKSQAPEYIDAEERPPHY